MTAETGSLNDAQLDRLLRTTAGIGEDSPVWWKGGREGYPLTFFAPCNDLFSWGFSGVEEVTPEGLDDYVAAVSECNGDARLGGCLYAARVAGMRPQNAMYSAFPTELWPLFDAAGPERAIDLGNPKTRPTVGGPQFDDRPRYELEVPAFRGEPLTPEQIRELLTGTAFEYTDVIRWTVDEDGSLRFVLVSWDHNEPWDVRTIELDADVADELSLRLRTEEASKGRYRVDDYEIATAIVREVDSQITSDS